MKKFTVYLVIFCLIGALAVPAFGTGSKIVDDADLLSDAEEEYLEAKARDMVSVYGMDVVILTVGSTDGYYIGDYADDYYDNNGYGVGADYSGVLFMLAMDTREWYISTCGDGIYAVTDYGVGMLFSGVAEYLAADDYYTAFDVYLDELDGYYAEFSQGDPVDGYMSEYVGPGSYEPNYSGEVVIYDRHHRGVGSILIVSLVIGLVVAGISLAIMRGGMKTANRQSGAAAYLSSDVNITRRHNHFLYSRTSRVAKPQNHGGGHGGHGGGGSHVHRSSGGRSHGGGGGRF